MPPRPGEHPGPSQGCGPRTPHPAERSRPVTLPKCELTEERTLRVQTGWVAPPPAHWGSDVTVLCVESAGFAASFVSRRSHYKTVTIAGSQQGRARNLIARISSDHTLVFSAERPRGEHPLATNANPTLAGRKERSLVNRTPLSPPAPRNPAQLPGGAGGATPLTRAVPRGDRLRKLGNSLASAKSVSKTHGC